MTAWWNGAATPFDLESDGPDPTVARIITACVAPVRPGGVVVVTTWMAQPERDIPAEATAVHGISTEAAERDGGPRENVIAGVASALAANCGGDVPCVGHNVRYDLTLLDREMRRLGIGSLGTDLRFATGAPEVTVRIDGRQVGAFHVIDTLVLDKAVDPYRKGSRKLVDVAEHYGVPIQGDAHTADADALAAGRIAWAIARRAGMANGEGPHGYDMALQQDVMEMYRDRREPHVIGRAFAELGRMTLPDLHRAQAGWAAEQARGLAAYFRRTGKGDPDGVSEAWPLEPVTAPDGGAPGIETAGTGGLL